jgi:hypothetical protein
MTVGAGDFVELRGRPWLVETTGLANSLATIQLSCIADDAQGEPLEVLWDAEIGATLLNHDDWLTLGNGGPDSAEVLSVYLRVIK